MPKPNPKHNKTNKTEGKPPKNLNGPEFQFIETEPFDQFSEGIEAVIMGHSLELMYYDTQRALWIESVSYGSERDKMVYRWKATTDENKKAFKKLMPVEAQEAVEKQMVYFGPFMRIELPIMHGIIKRDTIKKNGYDYEIRFIENPKIDD